MKSEFSLSNLISREFRMCSSPSLCKPYVYIVDRLLFFFMKYKKWNRKESCCFYKCGICSSVFSLACNFSGIRFSELRLTNRLGVFCLQRIVFRSHEIYKYDWHFLSFFRRKSKSVEWSQQSDYIMTQGQSYSLVWGNEACKYHQSALVWNLLIIAF